MTKKLTKAERLEAARNLEPDDCNIMAVGNGRYTREMSERRAAHRSDATTGPASSTEGTTDPAASSTKVKVDHGTR